MTLLLIVLLILLLFGGGFWGWRGGYHTTHGTPYYGGLGLVLVVILVVFLLGFPTAPVVR